MAKTRKGSNNKKNTTVKGIKKSSNRSSELRKIASLNKSASILRDVPVRPHFSREINTKHEFVTGRTYNGLNEVTTANLPSLNDFALFQNVFEMSPDQLASAIKHSHHGTNLHNGIEIRKSRLVHSIDIADSKASSIFLEAFRPFERAVEEAVGKRNKWDYATLSSLPHSSVQQWHIDVEPMVDAPPGTIKDYISYVFIYAVEEDTHLWVNVDGKHIKLLIPVGTSLTMPHISTCITSYISTCAIILILSYTHRISVGHGWQLPPRRWYLQPRTHSRTLLLRLRVISTQQQR